MLLWRIGSTTPDYGPNDPSGRGAEITGGRWNRKGLPVVYAASNVSLACLETLVHFNSDDLPFNRYLICIDVPSPVWRRRRTESAASLPAGWDAVPAGFVSMQFGSDWLQDCKQAVLEVPSSIIRQDPIYLINPRHKDASLITFTVGDRFNYDHRLRAR